MLNLPVLSRVAACLVLFALPHMVVGQDMPLSGLLMEGEGWQLVAEGFQFTEGPAADAAGNLFFTDVPRSTIHKIDLDGKVTVFAENTSNTNGLMFGPDGRLYGCQNGKRRIVAWTPDGKETAIAEDVESNDLVVNAAGGVYFTDPPHKQVWYVSPQGKKEVVATGLSPNGVILWADGGTLVVTEANQPHLWTFRVEPNGTLTSKDRYYGPLQMPPGAEKPGSDGMTIDRDGRLYVATAAGLQVFDPTGRACGTLLKPQRAFLSNVCFGGPRFDTLFVTCTDKVYKRKTRTTGVRYTAPVKK